MVPMEGEQQVPSLSAAAQFEQTVTEQSEPIHELIEGVVTRRSITHPDERGTLVEIFNPAWGLSDEPLVYVYQITIRPGQVKGFVLHRTYNDRLFFSLGTVKVVLYDDREGSPTRGMLNELFFSEQQPRPPGHPLERLARGSERRRYGCALRQLPDEAVQPRRSGQVGDAQGFRPDPVLVLRSWRRTARTIRDVLRNAHADPEVQGEPLVTVVLATYNWSSVLRHSIRSVLWQTYPNLELLVVGDGCTDDSEEVVASFGDERVRWHNLSANTASQVTPNNTGIDMARGTYIAYQGHDDLWHPKHLAMMLAHMQRADAELAYNLAELIGPPGSRMRLLSGRGREAQLPMGRWLPPNSLVHRTELARRIGGWRTWEEADRPPDVDFLNRARRAAARFIRVPAMTAFKLAASWRLNVYRDRPSHEQEALMRRIESERWFTERELAAWALVRLLRLEARLPRDEPESHGDAKALKAWSRKVRGLD